MHWSLALKVGSAAKNGTVIQSRRRASSAYALSRVCTRVTWAGDSAACGSIVGFPWTLPSFHAVTTLLQTKVDPSLVALHLFGHLLRRATSGNWLPEVHRRSRSPRRTSPAYRRTTLNMQLFSMLLLVAPAMCLHIAAPAAPRFAVAQMQRAPAVVAMVSAGPPDDGTLFFSGSSRSLEMKPSSRPRMLLHSHFRRPLPLRSKSCATRLVLA